MNSKVMGVVMAVGFLLGGAFTSGISEDTDDPQPIDKSDLKTSAPFSGTAPGNIEVEKEHGQFSTKYELDDNGNDVFDDRGSNNCVDNSGYDSNEDKVGNDSL